MTIRKTLLAATALVALGGASPAPAPLPSPSPSPSLQLGTLAPVATVDARYQGYNIEMVEVTGGRFWAPYDALVNALANVRPAPVRFTHPCRT